MLLGDEKFLSTYFHIFRTDSRLLSNKQTEIYMRKKIWFRKFDGKWRFFWVSARH